MICTIWQINLIEACKFLSQLIKCSTVAMAQNFNGRHQHKWCLHAWWSCKFISQFWSYISAFIKWTAGISVPKDPAVILLNVWNHSCTPTPNRELVFSLLLAAKSFYCLFFFLEKIYSPNYYWTQKMWDFIIFNEILFSLNINTISDPLAVYNK